MKTATVTWITYKNYGTVLQAYALQSFIKSLGIDNDIISDRKIIAEKYHKTEVESKVETEKRTWLKKQIDHIRHPLQYIWLHCLKLKQKREKKQTSFYYRSQEKIKGFAENRLSITEPVSRCDLPVLNNKYDLFIAGSDQIWSPLPINFDGYFFLDFVTKKKGSYAPSLGTLNIPEDKKELIKGYVQNYSFCSVRENQSAEQFTEELEIPTEWVCDPTLLYDKVFWNNFCADIKSKERKYVLCYFLENKDWYFEYAKQLSKYLGKKLLLIPNFLDFCLKKNFIKEIVGPVDFVFLIKNADFILTDSYHGMIFSMIFEKQLIYLKRFDDAAPNCQNIRVYSLLDHLNLEKIIVPEKNFAPSDVQQIDYKYVSQKLSSHRCKSCDFLKKNINEA